MLQLTYLGYTCGEAVSPVITRLFLVSLDSNQLNSSSYVLSTDTNNGTSTISPSFEQAMLTNYDVRLKNHEQNGLGEYHVNTNVSKSVIQNASTVAETVLIEDIKFVRYAYTTVIPVYVIVALWFLLMVSCDKQLETAAATKSKLRSTVSSSAESTQIKSLKLLLLALMALFYLVAIIHEAAILTLITPIAIKSWGWAVQTAALTSSIIMIGYLVGRLLSMFVSAFIDPIIMLAVAIALLLFGTIQLLISQYSTTTNNVVIMSSLVILGLGQSALTAVNLFLVSKYVIITPAISSLYLISISVGWVLASYCGSRIYEAYGRLVVFWILLVLAVLVLLFYVMEVIVGKLIANANQSKSTHMNNGSYDGNEEAKEIAGNECEVNG